MMIKPARDLNNATLFGSPGPSLTEYEIPRTAFRDCFFAAVVVASRLLLSLGQLDPERNQVMVAQLVLGDISTTVVV
jgi:hypothetical protein